MKVVTGIFCHYLPIYKDINGCYCSTTLTNTFFSRYFDVVDKLLVATRVYRINKTYQEAHQEKISLPNVEIVEFMNLSKPLNYIRFSSREKKRLSAAIAQSDLVFIRGGVIANFACEICIKQKKPYLFESSGCAWDEYWNYSFLGKLLAPIMEIKTKRNIRNASYVVYVTEKWLQKRYPTKGESTNASNVMISKIDERVVGWRQDRIQSLLKQEKPEIVLGTIGGVGNRTKGQQFVLKAISLLKKKYSFRYELVGGGSTAFLEKTASRLNVDTNIRFMGQMTHEEVLKWLDSIDIYIQPSLQEGLPRSLIEAMSRACPAIGSTTAGIPELLEPACLFKRGKVRDLVKVLCALLSGNLQDHAAYNFEKAKQYELSLVNKRRSALYEKYKVFVLGEDEK